MNLAYQGTHALQSIAAFHPDGLPTKVMGQASGTDGLEDTPKKHFAPDQCIGAIEYADGLRAQLISGPYAPRVTNEDRTMSTSGSPPMARGDMYTGPCGRGKQASMAALSGARTNTRTKTYSDKRP